MTATINMTNFNTVESNSSNASKITNFSNQIESRNVLKRKKNSDVNKYIFAGLVALTFNGGTLTENSVSSSEEILKKSMTILVDENRNIPKYQRISESMLRETVNGDYFSFIVDASKQIEDVNTNMIDKIEKIHHIENVLFLLGFIVGGAILMAPLFSNVSFELAVPSSLFGFAASFPKVRGYLNER